MFKGRFLIGDCIEVTYKQVPVNKILFTFKHLAAKRIQYNLVVKPIGDIHVSLSTVNCVGMGEAEMTANMMLANVANHASLIIKHRLYERFYDDPDNFVWGSEGQAEKVEHALFQAGSLQLPEELRSPFPRRVHERLHRPWNEGKSTVTSEEAYCLIRQPGPICPLIEEAVWDEEEKADIIALVHQLRDWGQSWKNLAKTLLPSRV